MDRLGLAVGVAGADDEEVRVAEHAAEVELDDVDRLLVGGVAPRSRARPGRRRSRAATAVMRLASRLRSVQPLALDVGGDGVGHQVADRAARRDAAADQRGRDVDAAACRRSGRARRRPAARRAARRCRRGATPSRSATASSASSSTASGSRQSGSACAMSPPTMKVSSSSGRASWSLCSVSTVYDGPPRSTSTRETPSRASSADREPAQLDAVLDARVRLDLLVRRRVDRHEQHAVEPELRRSASCAQTRCPRCGGLNVPPSRPTRATRAQARTWPVALDEVLERAELAQADRAARVQLLGRVADLRAHAELAAVGEARRRVDVDAGGVDAELERPRRRRVAGDDRLGVARAVAR